ncbi:MAG: histidine phosphatase family protein [Clostridia bacterium]|nr:histidine phosphatase family protein [Clostridia bacterium]
MATTVIMVRHGFSMANEQNRFAGHWDIPLTALGKEQAACAASWFSVHPADAVYASDLMRAYETALPIAAVLGLAVQKEPGLREIRAGEWETLLFDELPLRYPKEFKLWTEDLGRSGCPGGETVAEVYERVWSAVSRLAARHDGETICLASHATPIRAICARALGYPAEEMAKVPWVSNASISIFEYENGVIRPISLDQTDHLGALRTKLPNNV